MTSTTINVSLVQRRLLSAKEAATYCGTTVRRFSSYCPVPPISMPSGSELYDILDLDNWIDGLKSNSADSDDDILQRLDK